MAYNVTPDDVRAINGSDATDEEIQQFIDAAICILEGVRACTTGKGVSQECLDKAAAFLAAHLMGSTNGGDSTDTLPVTDERFENYAIKRAISSSGNGDGLLGTPYGHAANALTQGCLQEADKAPAVIEFFG